MSHNVCDRLLPTRRQPQFDPSHGGAGRLIRTGSRSEPTPPEANLAAADVPDPSSALLKPTEYPSYKHAEATYAIKGNNIVYSPNSWLHDGASGSESYMREFAQAIFPSHNRGGWVLMLRAYFDRSELTPGVVAVGGFLYNSDGWVRFEKNWNEVLSSEGVKCFHMTDLETRQDEFGRGWEDPKRRKVFLRRLIGVIGSIKPLAVSSGMLTTDYEALSESQKRRIGSHPYVWCAIDAVTEAMKWVRDHSNSVAPIACVLDIGDKGKGEVLDTLTAAKQQNRDFDKYLNSVSFEKKTNMVPLQAADFFAYETAKQLLRIANLDSRDIRKSLGRLLRGRVMDVIGHYVDAKSLRWLAGSEGVASSSDAV